MKPKKSYVGGIKRKLADFFRGQKDVGVAYLFGSVAEGKTGPLSDIDVAVYLDEKMNKSERGDKKLSLINEISGVLGTDNFDLVVMNDISHTFNYEIIKHGKVLSSDEGVRVEMETKILSQYLDRRYYDIRHMESFLERVSGRGLL